MCRPSRTIRDGLQKTQCTKRILRTYYLKTVPYMQEGIYNLSGKGRKGERTRIRAGRTVKSQSHTSECRRIVKSQAEQVRLLSHAMTVYKKFIVSTT